MVRERWRFIDSGPTDPALNMAVDEVLLRTEPREPVFRIYRWRPRAVSMGYFQSFDEVRRRVGEQPIVRRISGGGAVRHGGDMTYAFVGSRDRFGRDATQVYRTFHEAILAALRRLGIEAAFRKTDGDTTSALCHEVARGFDIVCRVKKAFAQKLVGSAQKRSPSTFLLHGSIPLEKEGSDDQTTSLNEILGRLVTPYEVSRALREGVEAFFGVRLSAEGLTPGEEADARRLRDERYGTEAWNRRR